MSQITKISRNNTAKLTNDDGSMSVILHSTEVIRHNPHTRTVRLNTGGWFTATTRTRMNQALNEWDIPAQVSFAVGKRVTRVKGLNKPFNGSICEFTY